MEAILHVFTFFSLCFVLWLNRRPCHTENTVESKVECAPSVVMFVKSDQ